MAAGVAFAAFSHCSPGRGFMASFLRTRRTDIAVTAEASQTASHTKERRRAKDSVGSTSDSF